MSTDYVMLVTQQEIDQLQDIYEDWDSITVAERNQRFLEVLGEHRTNMSTMAADEDKEVQIVIVDELSNAEQK